MATMWCGASATPKSARRYMARPGNRLNVAAKVAAVGRLLKRLHVGGLIRKVPRSRRWHVTPRGHGVLQGVLRLYHSGIPAALATAA